MSFIISDKDTAKLYVQFFGQEKPQINKISARMNRPISEILKPLKILAVVYYQFLKLSALTRVFKPDKTRLLVF